MKLASLDKAVLAKCLVQALLFADDRASKFAIHELDRWYAGSPPGRHVQVAGVDNSEVGLHEKVVRVCFGARSGHPFIGRI